MRRAMSLPRALALSLRQLADPAIVRILLKSLAITLAMFVGLAVAINAALPEVLSWWIDDTGDFYVVASVIVFIVLAWLLFRFVALFVLQFFAEDVVRAVEERYYPDKAGTARSVPFAEELRRGTRAAARALLINALAAPIALVLLVTGIGTALLFWAVNAVLLGRELQDMVWLRHRNGSDDMQPLGFANRFMLGGAVAGLLLVPFVNLLAPVMGAATATHLVHGRKPTRA